MASITVINFSRIGSGFELIGTSILYKKIREAIALSGV